MKRVIASIAILMMLIPSAFADNDTTTATNTVNIGAGTIFNGSGGSGGGGSGGASSSANGGAGTTVKHQVGESISYAAPSYAGAKGVSTSQMGGIFGSLTLSDTEVHEVEYTRQFIVESYLKAELITLAQAKGQAQSALSNLEFASRPRRFCGFGWKTNGKSLENLFGILSWTSFRGNAKVEGK